MEAGTNRFVAECFWPDVTDRDVRELDERIFALVDRLDPGEEVRFLGSILIREDEVVLCQFEGTAAAVRAAAERAGVPFERLLATTVAEPRKGSTTDA